MSSRLADALRLLASVLILGAFALVAWKVGLFERDAATKVATLTGKTAGIHWIVPAFIAVYAAITALGLFVSPLSYGTGAVFGFVRGANQQAPSRSISHRNRVRNYSGNAARYVRRRQVCRRYERRRPAATLHRAGGNDCSVRTVIPSQADREIATALIVRSRRALRR